jgi:frataxin-like iron-binding protein CyaY
MKGVGVQSGFYYFNFSVNNRPEWTSTAAGQRFPQLLSLEVQSAAKLMVNRLLS